MDNDDNNNGKRPPRRKGNYEVGYCKPPKHTQFKPGMSGHPKGRAKGARSFKTDLMDILNAPIPINKDGKQRKVSAQLAGLMRLREKALKGDARALERLLALAAAYNLDDRDQATTETLLDEDSQILANARERRRELGEPDDASAGESSQDREGEE